MNWWIHSKVDRLDTVMICLEVYQCNVNIVFEHGKESIAEDIQHSDLEEHILNI